MAPRPPLRSGPPPRLARQRPTRRGAGLSNRLVFCRRFELLVSGSMGSTAEIFFVKLVRPDGFEPPTTWFEARCSIQLSYGRNGCEVYRVLAGAARFPPTRRAGFTVTLARRYHLRGPAMSTSKPDLDRIQAAVGNSVHIHWRLFLTEGIILLVLGILAIVVPPVATIAVAVLIGWLLLLSGVVGLIATIRSRGAPGFWWSLISAVIGIAAGIVLLGWPLSGALSLTMILTVFLVLEGVVSILYALEHKRELSGRWGVMLFSGVIDLFLAGIIFAGLPGTAAWAIGLLVGVNLVFGGSALIAMALHARGPTAVVNKPA